MYARIETHYQYRLSTDGPINDDGVALESSSGYYLDLGYDIAGLVSGCTEITQIYTYG